MRPARPRRMNDEWKLEAPTFPTLPRTSMAQWREDIPALLASNPSRFLPSMQTSERGLSSVPLMRLAISSTGTPKEAMLSASSEWPDS